MKYINAQFLLPAELVRELQNYLQDAAALYPPIRRTKNAGEKFLATVRSWIAATARSAKNGKTALRPNLLPKSTA